MYGRIRNIGFVLLVALMAVGVTGFKVEAGVVHGCGMHRAVGCRGGFSRVLPGGAVGEAAVMKALRWLKATQNADGTWGTKPELGLMHSVDDTLAGVGLAVLTFLSHGEAPEHSKEFAPAVRRALDYLMNSIYIVKDANGEEVADPNGRVPYVKMKGTGDTEYGFLIATYALCEAYHLTKNRSLRDAAELALGRIISGQTAAGGWNNNMTHHAKGASNDLFLGAWAIQALRSAAMAGICPTGMKGCVDRAVSCLQHHNYSEKTGFTRYAYADSTGDQDGFSAVGCLCLQLLGHSGDTAVARALNTMQDWTPTSGTWRVVGCMGNSYYSYYATQCKYQAGMCANATKENFRECKTWFAVMKASFADEIIIVKDKSGCPILVKDAKGNDQQMGYWKSKDQRTCDMIETCLTAMQLMVNYRYLPTTSLKATKIDDEDWSVNVIDI